MAGGRPSEYDESYCAKVIELGKQGRSFAQVACELGIVRNTLTAWEQNHPEFLIAMGQYRDECLSYWEQMGQDGAEGKKDVNASLWSRSMAARFPKEYTERKATELTGKDGAAIEIAHTSIPDADLDERIKTLMKAAGVP